MTSLDSFINNKVVISFVEKQFKENYDKESVPKWVNWEMFKSERIKELTESLYETIENGSDRTGWNSNLMIGFASGNYDPGASLNWDYFSEFEVDIPIEIIRVVIPDYNGSETEDASESEAENEEESENEEE